LLEQQTVQARGAAAWIEQRGQPIIETGLAVGEAGDLSA
jgi:hypothetical protein